MGLKSISRKHGADIAYALHITHVLRVLLSGVILWGAMLTGAVSARAELVIDKNLPAGNILVERVEGDTVYLRNELRDTAGWWFYWAFRG